MTGVVGREALLRRALELAMAARQAGDPPFGSLLVDAAGVVLAEAVNTTVSRGDITAHPELVLARWAAQTLSVAQRAEVTMYTSCEPCPMCAGAIERAHLPRVVFALSTAQLSDLKAPDAPPAAVPFVAEGPFLHREATVPVDGYYR